MTVRLTVGQATVRFLAQQYSGRDGVEHRLVAGCFGIFGHGNVAGIGEALLEAELEDPGALPYWTARNEQGAVHAASAYARMKNRLSTLAVTASVGPGATNMVTGAALATINRLPVLLLPARYRETLPWDSMLVAASGDNDATLMRIVYFAEATSTALKGPYDVSLVDGSPLLHGRGEIFAAGGGFGPRLRSRGRSARRRSRKSSARAHCGMGDPVHTCGEHRAAGRSPARNHGIAHALRRT